LDWPQQKAVAQKAATVIIVSRNQVGIDRALTEIQGEVKAYAVDLSKENNIKDFLRRLLTLIT
jgi:short-subunit dehydrogenase